MSNPDCHELRVLAMNGRIFRLTVERIEKIIGSRQFIQSGILFCILLGLADPLLLIESIPLAWRGLFWLLNGALTVAIWYGLFRIAAHFLHRSQRDWVIPSPILVAASVTIVLSFSRWLAETLLEIPGLWENPLWFESFRYSTIALIFEALLAMFLPSNITGASPETTKSDLDADAGEPIQAHEPTRMLVAGVRRIPIEDLLYLKSIEHYVEFVTATGSELTRVPLKELLAQLEPDDGVQPHRSYWVHRRAIEGLIRHGGNASLVLKDGTEIPVSRSRRRPVATWVKTYMGER